MTFQSTLPRGSDASALSANYNLGISIHAPSRERHYANAAWPHGHNISIHAPSRERRLRSLLWLIRPLLFQSTLPRGSDFIDMFRTGTYNRISIHAPSRERRLSPCSCSADGNFNPRSLAGATSFSSSFSFKVFYFNPRSLAGATAEDIFKLGFVTIFQSTLPRGSDPAGEQQITIIPAYFNPRSLAGAT